MSVPKHPLTPAQWEHLRQLAQDLDAGQLDWIGGFLAGFLEGRNGSPQAAAQEPAARPTALVLYASQTGNAEGVARKLHGRLQAQGWDARLDSMAACKPAQLKREDTLLVVASTYGEGDPPDNARLFHEFLLGPKAPRLEALRFAVLALGDASYEHFCKTGQDFDRRLEELGAGRLLARVDCDVDYEAAADAWIGEVLAKLAQAAAPKAVAVASATAPSAAAYSKQRPFPARLLENLRLSGRDSTKEVRHIELSLEGSGLSYQPGDALGVLPGNWPRRVAELAEALKLDLAAPTGGGDLEHALLREYEITTLTRPFLEKYAALAQSAELTALLADGRREELRAFCQGREIIDVVRRYPVAGIEAGQFLGLLRKLPPRLYSIASSPSAHPGEAHLTVAVLRYESHGLARQGVASTYLAERVGADGTVPVYVQENPHFRLPADPAAAIIMVGPGTGVAPFRAFLAEREALGAKGKNWLFFGDRTFHSDFLYQAEWLDYRAKGLLHRIDVAFSRDGAEKVYVQQRLAQQAREVYAWLEEGAHFYVCGEAQKMAADVHEALLGLVAQAGGLGRERAEAYVEALRAANRYQRDVY